MKANITCVQFHGVLMNKRENIKKMEEWVRTTKKEKPNTDLIIFPELCLTGYACEDGYYEMAETFPEGESILEIGKIAKENHVAIIFGFVEKDKTKGAKVLYNTAAFLSNTGEAIGSYRKVHLVDGVETKWFTHGDEYKVFDTDFGKIGIMICWDSAFPEVARILALKGAEIIAVPAAWEEPNGGDWDIVQSARSFDNVLYVASCNQIGTEKDLTFFGKSKIVGPLGRVINELNNEEGAVTAELDLSVLHELRDGYYALLKDRRIETYSEILGK